MKFLTSPIAHRVIYGSIDQSECCDKVFKAIRDRLYGEFTICSNGSITCIRAQRPIGLYHNSFEPSVLIDISQEGQSIRCKLNYSLSDRVKKFIHLFYSFLVLFEAILIICWITTEAMPMGLLLLPIGMIFASQAFVSVGFNVMVNKYDQLLTDAIESE